MCPKIVFMRVNVHKNYLSIYKDISWILLEGLTITTKHSVFADSLHVIIKMFPGMILSLFITINCSTNEYHNTVRLPYYPQTERDKQK